MGYLLRGLYQTVRDPPTLFQTVSLSAWVNRDMFCRVGGAPRDFSSPQDVIRHRLTPVH